MEAPPLAGGTFLNAWRKRTTSDLFGVIRKTMPASSPGSLSNQEALSLIAFILTSNGAAAGADDLSADAATRPSATSPPARLPPRKPGHPARQAVRERAVRPSASRSKVK